MDWFALIPTIISVAGTVKSLIDIAQNNDDLVTKIKESLPTIAHALEEYGAKFFPGVKDELRIAAAAMAAFDPNITKWLQESLNLAMDPSPKLVVDGIYGPKTKAAVELAQTKLGLPVDGWAGQLTQSAIYALRQKTIPLPAPAAPATPA
jgi:peptidoglycan hydrolase-like protein with peptidoglycan-binding domain